MSLTRKRTYRWLLRGLLVLASSFALLVLIGVALAWTAMGRQATGVRRARMEASPQWAGGGFDNPQPLWNDPWGMLAGIINRSADSAPHVAVDVVRDTATTLASPPDSGLRVTWFGHSSMLVEIDSHVVLTDPVWGESPSPIPSLGPQRWYPPPLPLSALPAVDAVVISHDHYDHLDYPTIVAIKDWDTTFVVPLGVAEHLVYWGVPEGRIRELDWWQRTRVGELTIACTPARHASGRQLTDQNGTLWAGYALLGASHRVYFSGDTGLFPALAEIGERFGPFDLTMVEVGAYDQAWPDWHIGPEQAIVAHRMLRGRLFMPVHWGLFDLAYHGWTEPVERTLAAAAAAQQRVFAPQPGQSFEPTAPPAQRRWWPERPWRSAREYPLVSTRNGDPAERMQP